MGKKQIQKALRIFSQRAKRTFKPEKILLFGSYAKGDASSYSDVDVVVVSNRFNRIPEDKRLDILYPLTTDLEPDFHVFGFTPEEFKDISPFSSIAEVKNRAVSLL